MLQDSVTRDHAEFPTGMEAFRHAMPPGSPANDRLPAFAPRAFPSDAHAIIRCPGPSVVSSGRARARQWVLEFAPRSAPFIEPLMGWVGGTDPLRHVQLRFPSREAAIAYAEREGLPYVVQEPTHLPAAVRMRSSDQAARPVLLQDGGPTGPAANDSAPGPAELGHRAA
ncbi:NADH dehydrogenase ubiquinone Fe-S protein 4 [Roseomonas chloroacetimidivorans]|uniref:NADH dehydrogenase ubiquinone Fe-S protein 4 n=1 Tax=Roseomonas chloroacetimidivorans TaxID=1766656 RepID=UPI003C766175